MPDRRLVLGLLASLAGLAALAAPAPSVSGGEERSPHPFYDDKGTLDWSSKLADAQKAAKKARKLIFIEYGRET